MKLPADLPPEAVTAIIDAREQTPLDLSLLSTILFTVARRRWRELRALASTIEETT